MLKSYRNQTSLFLERGSFRLIQKVKYWEAIPYIDEYLIYDNGQMLYFLADKAGKTKFLRRKTISLNLGFWPHTKENSKKWIEILQEKKYLYPRKIENLLPKVHTFQNENLSTAFYPNKISDKRRASPTKDIFNAPGDH